MTKDTESSDLQRRQEKELDALWLRHYAERKALVERQKAEYEAVLLGTWQRRQDLHN